MNEIEIVNELAKQFKEIVLGKFARYAILYYKELPNIEHCNFEFIHNECEKLGFHIYKTKESPIDTDFLQKVWKRYGRSVVIYSDFSLTQINHTKDFRKA